MKRPRVWNSTWWRTCLALASGIGIAMSAFARESSASVRLSHLAGISPRQRAPLERVRNALLEQLPPGTPVGFVYRYLDAKATGADAVSDYDLLDENREVRCTIGFDPDTFELVKEHFLVTFAFDEGSRLKDVRITRRLTGP